MVAEGGHVLQPQLCKVPVEGTGGLHYNHENQRVLMDLSHTFKKYHGSSLGGDVTLDFFVEIVDLL